MWYISRVLHYQPHLIVSRYIVIKNSREKKNGGESLFLFLLDYCYRFVFWKAEESKRVELRVCISTVV